nr:hypothetical protein [Actinomyces oris]
MSDSIQQANTENYNNKTPRLRVRLNRFTASASGSALAAETECSQKDFTELCVTSLSESRVQISMNVDAMNARRLDIATIQLQRNDMKTLFLIILNSSDDGKYSGEILVTSRDKIVEATALENRKFRRINQLDEDIADTLQTSVACSSTKCRRAWVDAARSLPPGSVLREAVRKGLS